MTAPLSIGGLSLGGRVLVAPMTGITDLPFRRAAARLGAAYVATEMVACETFARGRPDVVRRAAVGDGLPLMVIQLVGREPRWLAEGARLAAAAGADLIDLNMGCPAKEVTSGASGAALMRSLDLAERLIAAAVEAGQRPVTVKMRLGWDHAERTAPELAVRAERAGAQALTVHGRTRQQFYKGTVDWRAVAEVKSATRLPVIVNGDIVDAASARAALAQSGADGVMIGRGAVGRPWEPAVIEAEIGERTTHPGLPQDQRLAHVLDHFRDSLRFYGDALGVRVFRKHLAAYIDNASYPACAVVRRAARARLCRLDSPDHIEDALTALWTGGPEAIPRAAA